MGFLDRVFGRKAESNGPQSLPMTSVSSPYSTSEGFRGGLDEYKGWTYACTRAIAEKVGSIELQLNRRKGDDIEIIHDHPVLTLLRDANPFMTFQDIAVATQSYLELEGNEFWWISFEGKTPVSIWPLRPDLVSVVPDAKTYVKEYVYKIGNEKFKIPPTAIIPFKEFNPKDPFRGMGTTYAAASAINSDNYARAWQEAFFKNGARIDGYLTKDGEMTEAEHKELQNRWNDKFKGVEKSHKTPVLSGGLKYVQVGGTMKDMDFPNLRVMSRDEILAMFRVPKTVLGITDGTQTRASAETSEYVFMKETIKPKMQKFVRTLNEYLLPMFGLDTSEYSITFKDPVPENRELELSTYQNGLINGWLSVNEVRAKEALPPVENGDAPRVGFGTEPLGTPVEKAKRVNNAKPEAKATVEVVAKEIVKDLAPMIKAIADNEEFERRGKIANEAQIKRATPYEKKLSGIMQGYFNDQKERVLAEFDQTFKKNVKATKAQADDLFDPEAESEELVKLVKKFFTTLVQEEGDEALVAAGLDTAFNARSERVQAVILKNIQKFAGEVNDETEKQVREAIAAGIDEGEATQDIRKRIQEVSAFDVVRSEVIARTETTRAQNMASIEAWRESEVVESKVWYTAEDERVDDECAALHGEEFGLDENVDPGNSYGRVEGPPIHPNCRCTLLPVVTEKKARGAELKEADLINQLAEIEAELDEPTV